VALSIYCDESEEKARVGALKHFTEYMDGAVRSYELYSRHFANTKGYEAYAQAADAVLDREEMSRNMGQMWFENHVWGTPEMCAEKIDSIRKLLEPAEIVSIPKMGSMTFDEAAKSMTLFAKEVLPAVHEMEAPAHV
jgi:alkanesulfonate monooxygenase SsuD/methylene tetrahydromethanopterin reductase-like flavin-dependent oxidoreductase (luciferase family)